MTEQTQNMALVEAQAEVEEVPQRFAVVVGEDVINVVDAFADYKPPEEGARLVPDPEWRAVRGGRCTAGNEFLPPIVIINRYKMAADIDARAVAIYDSKAALIEEYKNREQQARAYKAAGYSGQAPRVKAFSDAEGITLRAGADIVIRQADGLYDARDRISDLRMGKRALTRKDANGAYVLNDDDALALHSATLAELDGIAASIA